MTLEGPPLRLETSRFAPLMRLQASTLSWRLFYV